MGTFTWTVCANLPEGIGPALPARHQLDITQAGQQRERAQTTKPRDQHNTTTARAPRSEVAR